MSTFKFFGKETTTGTERNQQPQPAQPDGKAHIYNLIIVDESGSMCGLEAVTLSGIQETINTIRQAQQEFGDKQQHSFN